MYNAQEINERIAGKIQAVPKKGPFDYDPLVYYAAGKGGT